MHPVAPVLGQHQAGVVEHVVKPGGPVRRVASHSPRASAGAMNASSIRATNCFMAGTMRSRTWSR